MTRQIVLPSGFEVWEHGKLVAVAVRDIYAGEPWGAEMFVNYAGAPADLPEAVIRLRTFTISTALPKETANAIR
ncbi:hypothetical protein NL532_24180 [Mesorhizobium sp. C120A]|uniref:hypothetical protein n=1 Tax=unclassified Mesorhizobium TaxID=325217 RepID=UPI0003D01FEC|nr:MULTISPECIES: hypothetical protein [unclassified Mesorhizobium]ESZ60668.1 hypothetical protein X728_15135 [Mesorhizobium sp. L103C120A0]WJI43708.1 hypothetical protein NL532_24180 [Mesorhizobium sp. C120A]